MSSSGMPISFVFQVSGDMEAKQKIQQVGGAFGNFGQKAEVVNTQTERLPTNFKAAALGMTTAATGAFALFTQFDNLEKIETRISASEKELTSSRATLLSSQAALSKLQEQGVVSGVAFEQAQLRVSAAEQQVQIASERLSQAQGDLSQGQLQFALSVVPTTLGMITTLQGSFKGFNATNLLTRMGIIQTSASTLTLNGMFGGTTASSAGAAMGMRTLGVAMRTLALNPLFLGLTAVATVLTLVGTNAFGVRDAMDSFAKKVEEVFPILKPVFDFFRTVSQALFPEAKDETETLSSAMSKEFQAISSDVGASVTTQVASMVTLQDSFTATQTIGSEQISTLADTIGSKADSIVSDANRIDKALKKIGRGGLSEAEIFGTAPAVNSFREVPNPLGGTISVYDPFVGSQRISEIKNQMASVGGQKRPKAGSFNIFDVAMGDGTDRLRNQFASGSISSTINPRSIAGFDNVKSGSTTINITVNGDVSGEELVDKVRQNINKYMMSIT